MTRTHKIALVIAATLTLLVGLALFQAARQAASHPDKGALNAAGIILLPQSRAWPNLPLLDQHGEVLPVSRLQGKWTLVFFGYTFCPDICPTTLAELRQLLGSLPAEQRQQVQVLMVSVDPQRDTPQQLRDYLAYFDPDYIGLTGQLDDIQQLANALSIPFIPGDSSQENYTVDHSGNLALLGPDGRQQGFIRAPLNLAQLQQQLPKLLQRQP
ncbi:cytochrome c oxidase assembly protein [Pseudomonas fluvialis]|jgi:protein SCO1/2|uniref:Copper-binding protein n=1 Tax=Pseudomonas fluvialis TaxID=1793966 RepID=A0A2I0CPG4_9PSED|nr:MULTISPECIES: SCO family protein [Pseudomonas]MBP8262530.1 SCO family protein [Pseudomonas sp.]OXM39997.1 cytochrome c oxidase assembly protein [Pseudomonas fluvialis]PKF71040.1 SCO family protein [Pseudomonas pharmacofabricae]GGH90631.1 copper-binding protein [Pseudomonas fluvialis]